MGLGMDGLKEGGKKVCVTGASGFIASWIVNHLLHRGYSVNATVRCLSDEKKTSHLLALEGANERLKLFEADLLKEGSFDLAIHGCHGVFHAASPAQMDSSNPQEELIDPAVKGTLNVLSSCAKTPSVKRVVFTSSMASVLLSGRPLTPEVVVDETWFSIPEFCEHSTMKWYLLSKTLAEEAAWKFAKDNGIDMVTINPGVVLGPILQPILTSSSSFVLGLINGSENFENASFGWVHVKDVADAHILAFETPSANGRYLLTESVAHISEILEILQEMYPSLKLPNKCEDNIPIAPKYKVSQEKVRSLGLDYIPLKTSLMDTVECLKDRKFITM